MDRDFFVKLTLGAYRVTDFLPPAEQKKAEIRSLANSVLAHLILFSENNPITSEQRSSLAPKIQEEISSLVRYFVELKTAAQLKKNTASFLKKSTRRLQGGLSNNLLFPLLRFLKNQKRGIPFQNARGRFWAFCRTRKKPRYGNSRRFFPRLPRERSEETLMISCSTTLLNGKGSGMPYSTALSSKLWKTSEEN
jgi:hypothetical protein